jgi:hypothetical protein
MHFPIAAIVTVPYTAAQSAGKEDIVLLTVLRVSDQSLFNFCLSVLENFSVKFYALASATKSSN